MVVLGVGGGFSGASVVVSNSIEVGRSIEFGGPFGVDKGLVVCHVGVGVGGTIVVDDCVVVVGGTVVKYVSKVVSFA